MSNVSLCPVLPNRPATPSASPSDEGVPSNAVVCLFPGLIQGGAWTKKKNILRNRTVRQLMKHGHANWTRGVLDVLELFRRNTDYNLH